MTLDTTNWKKETAMKKTLGDKWIYLLSTDVFFRKPYSTLIFEIYTTNSNIMIVFSRKP